MMLVDANLLLYAAFEDFDARHERARSWLEDALSGPSRVGLPWPSLLAFLRIATHPRLLARPLTTDVAWRQVTDWLATPNVWQPAPTARHVEVFGRLATATRAAGNLLHDAHLAALALEHGLTVYSTDGDFARFADVRWVDPLVR